jgi:hypothetical protein
MRYSTLATLLSAVAVSSARRLARQGPKVTYEGYKVYRVMTSEDEAAIEDRLSGLQVTIMEDHHPETWVDVVVSPEAISGFESLNMETQVLHEDLARDIEAEAAYNPYTSMHVIIPPNAEQCTDLLCRKKRTWCLSCDALD